VISDALSVAADSLAVIAALIAVIAALISVAAALVIIRSYRGVVRTGVPAAIREGIAEEHANAGEEDDGVKRSSQKPPWTNKRKQASYGGLVQDAEVEMVQ
jgi:hypothetical protein